MTRSKIFDFRRLGGLHIKQGDRQIFIKFYFERQKNKIKVIMHYDNKSNLLTTTKTKIKNNN